MLDQADWPDLSRVTPFMKSYSRRKISRHENAVENDIKKCYKFILEQNCILIKYLILFTVEARLLKVSSNY